LISPILRRFAKRFLDLGRQKVCEYDLAFGNCLHFLLPVTDDTVFLDVEAGSGNNAVLAREE
jgi:hypothetical protein